MNFVKLTKLKKGDKVAILSPSFAAPGKWPLVYELGLKRLKDIFELEPVAFPATKKLGATKEERAKDLIDAFENKEIKAVIASLGGDDQITYIKNLSSAPFINNPKPFFGFSDNTHFENFLWLNGIPSYYGGSLFTEFAMQKRMDPYTIEYLKHALFDEGEFELKPSDTYNDIGLDWNDPANLEKERTYEKNEGWFWDGTQSAKGITWGGCVEAIDELLRHGGQIPSLQEFENVVIFAETSEEIPSADYVYRLFRALGERGILQRIKGILIGRPKAWEFGKERNGEEKSNHRKHQREAILRAVRQYNLLVPIVQNIDIGHTAPQIPLPNGRPIKIDAEKKKIFVDF
jgi:muramoyltetrapeptide carboxypeptidase LdcA involved in peptidoglycan recycling